MNSRISEVRKALNLTQEKFAERIGLTRNFVWMIEKGERIPSDRTISDICREFGVSETWLRTGEGPMKVEMSEDEEFTKAITEIKVSDDRVKEVLKLYWALPEEKKKTIWELIDYFTQK